VKRRNVNVDAVTPAPAEVVFGLLADGSSWPAWSPLESVEIERPGDAPPEGVGAIRVNRRGRTTGRDQITELVPNRRLEYRTLSGVPVRDYVGEVDLTPSAGGGTAIHLHSSFFPKTPAMGWLLETGLRRFLQQCANGLAEHAAAVSSSSADTTRDARPA